MLIDITGLRGENIKVQVPDWMAQPATLYTNRPIIVNWPNEGMILTSGGGTPTWRAIEPWDLPGYVEPAPLPSYLELFQ